MIRLELERIEALELMGMVLAHQRPHPFATWLATATPEPPNNVKGGERSQATTLVSVVYVMMTIFYFMASLAALSVPKGMDAKEGFNEPFVCAAGRGPGLDVVDCRAGGAVPPARQ